jgi:hypothetical protein
MPLEVEIYRNYKHNMIGKKLRATLKTPNPQPSDWYRKAQILVETEMQDIAENAHGGQIDATSLPDEAAEMLDLYIDNQVLFQKDNRPLQSCVYLFCLFDSHIFSFTLSLSLDFYRKVGKKCAW